MQKTSLKKLTAFLITVLLCSACTHNPLADNDEKVGSRSVSSIDSLVEDAQMTPERMKARGLLAYSSGNFPEAATLLQSALLLNNQLNEASTKFLIYYSSLMIGDYQGALKLAESLANELPFLPIVYQQIGLAQMGLGNPKMAIDAFGKALDFDSHAPRVHFYLALAYAAIGKKTDEERSFAEGEREYKDILRFNPKDFAANYELASLYLYQNSHLEETASLLENCTESLQARTQEELPVTRSLYTQFYLPLSEGIYAYRKNNFDWAQTKLNFALAHMPAGAKADAAELYFYLAKTHSALHQDPEAKAFYEVAQSMDPHGAYAGEAESLARVITSRKSNEPSPP